MQQNLQIIKNVYLRRATNKCAFSVRCYMILICIKFQKQQVNVNQYYFCSYFYYFQRLGFMWSSSKTVKVGKNTADGLISRSDIIKRMFHVLFVFQKDTNPLNCNNFQMLYVLSFLMQCFSCAVTPVVLKYLLSITAWWRFMLEDVLL